ALRTFYSAFRRSGPRRRRNGDGNAGIWPHRNAALGARLRLGRGRRAVGGGGVGGLVVRGEPRDQEHTIARAIAAGVNYFDTAVQYGNGESEKNLGRVLQRLKPANVAVGTKVRLPASDFGGIADAVAKSLEGSLARLRLDRVDIFHLHNAITETGGG